MMRVTWSLVVVTWGVLGGYAIVALLSLPGVDLAGARSGDQRGNRAVVAVKDPNARELLGGLICCAP
jgi:hypothetical protein